MSMLDSFKSGQVAKDVRLKAAQGGVAAKAGELLSILVLLLQDEDEDVRTAAAATLSWLPHDAVVTFLSASEVSDDVREYFRTRSVAAAAAPMQEDDPSGADDVGLEEPGKVDREGIIQKLTKMSFFERLKAASKGTREIRSILIRDPSKMIAMAVLSSPKLTSPEVESFARMGNVSEEVLRSIGSNRAWMKNYGVVVALVEECEDAAGDDAQPDAPAQ